MEEIDIPSGDWTLVDQEQYRVLLRERDQFRALCDIKDAVIARIRQNQGAFQDKVHIDRAEFERLEAQAKYNVDATLRVSIAEDKIDAARRARDDAKERARQANVRADQAEAAVRESERKMDKFKISGGCDACQAGKRAAEDALDVSKRDQQILKNRIAKAQRVLSPTVGFNVPSPGYPSPNELTEEIRKGLDNPFWKA